MGIWVPPDTRDAVIDFVNRWSKKAGIAAGRFIPWLGVSGSKFYRWSTRYGKVNEHNGWIPRDFWLEDWEKQPDWPYIWFLSRCSPHECRRSPRIGLISTISRLSYFSNLHLCTSLSRGLLKEGY